MGAVYIKDCKSIGEAINKIKFELRVPEYYQPTIPTYFTKPRESYLPVINGEFATWDEYYERHPEMRAETENRVVPEMIYNPDDFNMCMASLSTASIIDLCVNEVPFEFTKYSDVQWVLDLMDGYVEEVKSYIGFSQELDIFLQKLYKARAEIAKVNERNMTLFMKLDKKLGIKREASLESILSMML